MKALLAGLGDEVSIARAAGDVIPFGRTLRKGEA